MKIETACRRLIEDFKSRPTLRSGSLITTVFGDAIAPRGGKVWLGSLIEVMSHFGVGERLVRTSVFRLARDGWLQSEQIGRRSYYSLTDDGRERFDLATHRIYGSPASGWDGQWCLLLLSGLETAIKDSVRKECGWLGFGPMSANVLAHPAPNLADLDITMQRLGVVDELVVVSGKTVRNEAGMRCLAHDSWNLAELDVRYGEFVTTFRPIMRAIEKDSQLSDKTAFLARTMLIQEYRKIMLRDPMLPEELLPGDWQGAAAYRLCRNLYRVLHGPADQYLSEAMETADGPLPPPSNAFWTRFGGLQENTRRKVSNG
ncbi:MAG: phenylacetic acid degradation operon negative regulatory protein PaaX [Proteobacteria bacterium]|nr:phenylacetic acid degradation operon negative regulatory protein PaaX [Pseudomonadota bacterium]MCH9005177.1 phenylacetic acid degradation operon negative regulatory protein PaaX [Pseudomonadota bacterium]